MKKAGDLIVFSGSAHPELAREICEFLYLELGELVVAQFPDGETKVRIQEDVRGRDVFVVQPTCPDVNRCLMELLIITDALKRASAERVTAVMPYYGYARQDRKHAGRVPITAKLVANLITVSGADRVLTMDLHADQIQGFFDLPVDHLSARYDLAQNIADREIERPVLVSTDIGGTKIIDAYREVFPGMDAAIIEKRRKSDDEVERGHVVGEVDGRNVIIVDDMITTAGSMCQAVSTVWEYGAKSVSCIASHGLFCGPAWDRLSQVEIGKLIVSNTVPVDESLAARHGVRLEVVSVSRTLADAIKAINSNESVSKLFAFKVKALAQRLRRKAGACR